MEITEAVALVEKYFARMDKAFKRPVFSEWAIVAVKSDRFEVLHYCGFRPDSFEKDFAGDSVQLRNEYDLGQDQAGHFEFVRDAKGEAMDAFISLGAGVVLICNNPELSIEQITKDPTWAGAQIPFVNLTECFRLKPLTV